MFHNAPEIPEELAVSAGALTRTKVWLQSSVSAVPLTPHHQWVVQTGGG